MTLPSKLRDSAWKMWQSVFVLGWMCLLGCADSGAEQRYGIVSDWRQYESRNGLGVHRRMWEQNSVRCITPQKLSNRLDSVEVIVLVSQSFDPPGVDARRWLEKWLQAVPGRTVVYFGRDFNADLYYYQQTLSALSLDQQRLARERMARLQATDLQDRLDAYTENNFCDWFYLQTDQPSTIAEDISGPWADSLPTGAGWPLRTRLLPPSRRFEKQTPSWVQSPPSQGPQDDSGQTNSATEVATEEATPEDFVVRSIWKQEEYGSPEQWKAAFSKLLSSEVLLQSEAEEPLIFRLRDRHRLGDGQIIVVANGAPFLNASLVEPLFGEVAQQIIQECLPARRAALLAYDIHGLQISYIDETNASGAGLELLTQWPLSVITMAAAILGLVACAYLLPILGRPRSLPARSVSDFGLHVEAIGQMLHEAGDQSFAEQTIADYYRTVRGERPPSWLNPAVPELSTVVNRPAASEQSETTN